MRTVAVLLFAVVLGPAAYGAAPRPVPPSPYLPLVYRYADAMIQRGRDAHGPQKTGLLLSALDRATFAPLDAPHAVPADDQNLLRVLYTLTELSTKPVYRDAADAELKWLLLNASSREARLAPWDDGFAWDVLADAPVAAHEGKAAGRAGPWMLWERCFDLDPEASKRLVLGLGSQSAGAPASPRRTGFAIRALSVGFQRTRDPALLKAIEAALARLDAEQNAPPAEWLSAAIDCAGAAGPVPGPLAARLRGFASSQDDTFCGLGHDLTGKTGFAAGKSGEATTPLWVAGSGDLTTAAVGMMCVSRYENTGDVRYRALIHAAADAYRDAAPPAGEDLAPMTFGHAVSLQLAAWRSTARAEYLERATRLADLAVRTYFADGPLPRASSKSAHYGTARGADTLALALVELHLSILHITAVRCPPNTIDR